MENHLEDLSCLCSFLQLTSRLDVKSSALDTVLGLTGSEDGRTVITDEVMQCLLDLTTDKDGIISRDSYLAILNLSSSEAASQKLIKLGVIKTLSDLLMNGHSQIHLNTICMILSNLTRSEIGAQEFFKCTAANFPVLVDIFDKRDETGVFDYLATILSNITQLEEARLLILDKELCILPRLLPYTVYKNSLVRRGGIAGALRNLCFEVGYHEWLLSAEVDILPALLLPLAGSEQFTEEETDSLPIDLQYLPEDKLRENDPDVRKMLLEAIMKLCSTKYGRHYMKNHGVYLILRELHKWEQDSDVIEACEKVVAILISDEPPKELEDLHTVTIPEGLSFK